MTFLTRLLALAAVATAVMAWYPAAHAADADLSVKTALPLKAKPIPDIPFFTYIDDRLTYSHIFNATDAGYFSQNANGTYNGKTDMNVVAFTHFDTWQYGTNFFNIGYYKSGPNDPASPCTNAGSITDNAGTTAANCAGTTDQYGFIRSTVGFNEIFDTHMFTKGPLHNVSFEIGGDADSQNSYFGSGKRQFVAGLQFAFDLPYHGYFNIAPLYKTETGHSAFTQCGAVYALPAPNCNPDGVQHFKDTWAVEMNWDMNLGFLPESMQYWSISGRAGFYGPKGPMKAVSVLENTKTEINTEPVRLTFDAGKAIWGAKYTHQVDFWVAYRYWKNQYGYDSNLASFICTVPTNGVNVSTNSCTSSSYVTGVTLKF